MRAPTGTRVEETERIALHALDVIRREAGEQAAFDVGITDLHPELIKALGRLKFKTTGIQTVLQHSVEIAARTGKAR